MTSLPPKAIRYANDKIFWCFDISEPTSDVLQNDLQRKSSLIIITDVNMTSKRAFLQKVTFLLNSTTKRFYLNTIVVFGVFLSQRSPRIMSSAK